VRRDLLADQYVLDAAAGRGMARRAVAEADRELGEAGAAQRAAELVTGRRHLDRLADHRCVQARGGRGEQYLGQGLAGDDLVERPVAGHAQDADQRLRLVVPAGGAVPIAEQTLRQQVLRLADRRAGEAGHAVGGRVGVGPADQLGLVPGVAAEHPVGTPGDLGEPAEGGHPDQQVEPGGLAAGGVDQLGADRGGHRFGPERGAVAVPARHRRIQLLLGVGGRPSGRGGQPGHHVRCGQQVYDGRPAVGGQGEPGLVRGGAGGQPGGPPGAVGDGKAPIRVEQHLDRAVAQPEQPRLAVVQ
jgi:hypothetical protein